MATDHDRDLDALLDFLKRSRGFDFTGYKRPSLTRRITKRMQELGVAEYSEYLEHLEVHPAEFRNLFNTILINVTAFFRDDDPWAFLRAEAIPRILARKDDGAPIRVWSAGCATGQEAYSLAMCFAEALGVDQFRERVKVYATDVDDEALAQARSGSYSEKEVAALRPELLERYFDSIGGRHHFRKDLRRALIFGRNDLMHDAPISRIDVLACRNTLMYFDAPSQARALDRFHFALTDGGYLVLGRAETLLTHSATFAAVELKQRIFTKVARTLARDRRLASRAGAQAGGTDEDAEARVRDAAFAVAPVAQIAVSADGRLALANDRARALFRVGPADVGRLLQDLELSYRPFDLRSGIDQALRERRTVVVADVSTPIGNGDTRWFELHFTPLPGHDREPAGASVAVVDVTAIRELHRLVEQAQHELELAYQELQSTNEELETTNEELQSTNEELETMNAELQSTNEELHAINDEARLRSDDVDRLNAMLESVFSSLRRGVAVLDRDLRITVWNANAEELWGVRRSETEDAHFLDLDIGLPVDRLEEPIRVCLAGDSESEVVMVAATNRRGRAIECRVTVVPLRSHHGHDVRGAIVLMEDTSGAGEDRALAAFDERDDG